MSPCHLLGVLEAFEANILKPGGLKFFIVKPVCDESEIYNHERRTCSQNMHHEVNPPEITTFYTNNTNATDNDNQYNNTVQYFCASVFRLSGICGVFYFNAKDTRSGSFTCIRLLVGTCFITFSIPLTFSYGIQFQFNFNISATRMIYTLNA